MQIILTHNGVRVQATSQQENEDRKLPDLIRVSTVHGHFEIPRQIIETLAALVVQAHRATRIVDQDIAAGPDNVVPMMLRKQAD